LTIYASGLRPTKGGVVTSGMPSPSDKLAVTGQVSVYFGPKGYFSGAHDRELERIGSGSDRYRSISQCPDSSWEKLTEPYLGISPTPAPSAVA